MEAEEQGGAVGAGELNGVASEGRGGPAASDLSRVLVALMRGVLSRESAPLLWQSLFRLSSRVRDYVAVLGLDLLVDESEGYAYLKQREAVPGAPADTEIPALIPRRQLGYQVSLLLVLLRKKLAEFDASSGESRLILSVEEILEQMRLFLPDTRNEVRLKERVIAHVNRIVEMGFLRKLKGSSSQSDRFEVSRLLKAFVDAQWMDEFDRRLSEYAGLSGIEAGEGTNASDAGWIVDNREGAP